MDLEDQVSAFINRHDMLRGEERVLIALSGGPDSVCLLLMLHALKTEYSLQLHAAYIDHGLRPEETPKERAFCADLCRHYDVTFHTESIKVKAHQEEYGTNLQEAARELRYQRFEEIAARIGAHRIALGHNLNDQAETFMMRLLRGSGPGGLTGIPPVRGHIIRPLMCLSREQIEGYLEQEGIAFVVDSSNEKDVYLRNRIRSQLMPVLTELNPNVLETFERTTEVMREEERYFGIQVTKAMMRLITRKTDDAIELFLSPLMTLDTVILRRVLRRAIDETRGLRGIGFTHVEDIIHLIRESDAGGRVHLPHGIRAIKKYATLLITAEPPVTLGEFTLEAGVSLPLPEVELLISATLHDTLPSEAEDDDTKHAAVFDADKVKFPLIVRSRRDGDFFYPRGFGKRKKLQDFFVDEKVPRDERGAVPVVASGDDIIWLAGYRASETAAPEDESKRFVLLKAELLRRGAGE